MNRYVATLAGLGAAVMISAAAPAQSALLQHVRGTIEAVGGNSMTVATREGSTVTVALQQPLTVSSLRRLDLSAIKTGTFIGTAARPGPDGKLVAQEIFVFPESMRGTGEGYRPWDLTPDSTMTNATIGAEVAGTDGPVVTLDYKGGSQTVVVPKDTPIVGPVSASRADLKPGAPVFFTPTQGADGKLQVSRVIVGTDGVKLPL